MADVLQSTTREKLERLFDWFKDKACVLAFSGGVDSTMLGKALALAYEQGLLKIRPVAYFAESFTSTELEKTEARRIAGEIGLPLVVLESNEFDDPRFVANTPKRCYWCKRIRFAAIKELAQRELGVPNQCEVIVLDGANADDAQDYRPGQQAAREVGVRSPLAESGIAKSEIREIAACWKISVAAKPSTPCLATRLAYNMPLDNETLRLVEQAEITIKSFGAETCRARIDAPKTLRVELPDDEIERFAQAEVRRPLIEKLRALGFNFVSLDLEGFFSGKNNRSI